MEIVREGEVLGGKYRVERVLGQGGMGVVVLAQHVQLGQHVALKFLLPEACANPQAVARFIREARSAVQIRSEHVARVSDVGQLESGAPYMVMEFLRGSDLTQILAQRGALPIAEAVDYMLQACEAIAEAHSLGIVHRDLKPANLFLTQKPDGSSLVKVLDFGISKASRAELSGAPVNLTQTSALMGSPLYMSPEQVRNVKDVDARADIWSLGVILHELASGATPFLGDTAPALFAAITADPPASLRQHRPDAPAEFEVVLKRCLEKDRARRFASVAELARALRPFASQEGAASVGRISRILGENVDAASSLALQPTVAQISTGASSATVGEWGRTAGGRKRNRAGSFALLGVGALGAAVSAWFVFGRSAAPPGAASAATESSSVAAPAPPSAPDARKSFPATPVVSAELATPTPSALVKKSAASPAEKPAPKTAPRAPVPRTTATVKPEVSPTPSVRRTKDLFDDTQ